MNNSTAVSTQVSPPTTMLEYAQCYLMRGWSVIPIQPNDKKPAIPSWKEFQQRHATGGELEKWFGNGNPQGYNIGIVTGEISGITVLDVDDPLLLGEVKSRGVGDPIAARTGRGAHLIYNYDCLVKTTTGVQGIKGLDIRNDGAYIVAPPSIHPNGKQYSFVQPYWQDILPSTPPDWLIPPPPRTPQSNLVLLPPRPLQQEEVLRLRSALECIPADGYDTWLKVGMALKQGMGDQGLPIWHEWSATCREKYDPEIVESKWESFNEDRDNPVTIGTIFHLAREHGWVGARRENHSDKGNCQRLARHFGDLIRYIPEYKKWLIWGGTRWHTDEDGAIMRMAKAVPELMMDEAKTLADDQRQNLIKFALATENRAKLESMVELAASEPDIPLSQCWLDRDPFLFNVANGTINLKTGVLRPADRGDFITKQSPLELSAGVNHCPHWLAFLGQIMGGNPQLIHFLHKAIGYSLTGCTQEQCLFFCYGTGANGKSTLLNVLGQLLHDYAMQVDPATLMVKANVGGASPELARLRGARLVMTSEVEDGQRLAESTIKQLTGGDSVTVRNLYCDPFEYRPEFKLWVAGNHRPIIKGTDHAIWRRIMMIPFSVTIPPEQQDKDLGAKLKKELPGILAWAVEGCRLWQKEGLTPPPVMQAAVQAYREEMDTIGQWLDECCITAPQGKTWASSLYTSYKNWCESNGCYPLSQKRLGMSLAERGYVSQKMPQVVWLGIALTGARPTP